jgi:tetratricopeptide (TPR) repeat protein
MRAESGSCIICLDTSPPPIQSGCACRGDSGLAHIACLVQAAASQQARRGNGVWATAVWRQCQTCKQDYTGAMQTGLAEAWQSRVAGEAAEDSERLEAEIHLAVSLLQRGKNMEAEPMFRRLHEVLMRVFGAENPSTLAVAGNLASSLLNQGKYADAERIKREVLQVHKRVLGGEHPQTLASAGNLAACLTYQGKHVEAERIEREVLGARKRVLGAEHPETLASANNLAGSLSNQCKYAEAEQMLLAALASCQRVLGPAHPNTLTTARSLENVRARISSTPPTNTAAPAAADTARLLPAGTGVLVQRLVAKPEHNGKRARVLSFDARTGRYVVALDDGKELSLKAECVARAGCAAAGCASEEASSMCARCQVVRYCSRECQRTDWKAHKPVCTAAQP